MSHGPHSRGGPVETVEPPAKGRTGLAGGCLCSRVRFRYTGPLGGALGAVTVCHCSMCRRAQGYASAVAPILASAFRVEQGAEFVTEYESSPGKMRAFCRACGSPLYSRRTEAPERLRLRLGALDRAPPGLRVAAHIHTGEAPAWSWPSEAPAFPGVEPGRR